MTLILGAGFVLLIFAVSGQRSAGRLALRSQEAIAAGNELQKTVISLDNGLRGFVATGRDSALQPWTAGLRELPPEQRRLEALLSDQRPELAQLRAIESAIDDYVHLWGVPLIQIARERLPTARSVIVNANGRNRIDTIRTSFARLFASERAVARSRESRAEGRSDLAIAAGIGGVGLVILLSVGTGLLLRRFVVKPVLTVADASRALADGDMSARVPIAADDEIGDLARAFNSMADSLERSRQQVAERTIQLERSNEELDRFASVTSHDLQAPLATISMYAELLERRRGTELGDDVKLVDAISAASGLARDLIRGLLEYSRAGRAELRREPVDSARLVDEVLELLAAPIRDKGALISVGELPALEGDPRNLRQVFQNLIGNAIKFSDDSPRVAVDAELRDGEWEFRVTDDGIGMEPDQAAQIFEPFHRLHSEGTYPGTGIGLAVCERIVERHGGRIWAESEPGRGSTFRFTLPASPEAREPAPRGDAVPA